LRRLFFCSGETGDIVRTRNRISLCCSGMTVFAAGRENVSREFVTLPTVALRGLTIMPNMVIHFDLSRKKSIQAVEEAMKADGQLFVVAQIDAGIENPSLEDVHKTGTIVEVKQVSKLPNGIVRVLVLGTNRGKLISFDEEQEEYLYATVCPHTKIADQPDETTQEAMLRQLRELFEEYIKYNPKLGKVLAAKLPSMNTLEETIDQIAMTMPLGYETKQKILEMETLEERQLYLADILSNEIEILKVKGELTDKVKDRVDKHQKEYLLREQMAFIREELGEQDSFSDADQFSQAVDKLKASKEVKDRIKKEIVRFKNLSSSSSESAVERAYIETLLEMPWDKASKDSADMEKAEKILEEQHYGLEQVKERILEFLAVRCLNKTGDSPIICLVGPPGTGKTSIAKSVAEALGKKYVRISLGGVRDEAEIRGHRKTYVGAMPGRIVTGLKQVGVKNPLMLLDEIDKLGSDHKGDPASALLEVLDSEQNHKFRDHYVEIPVDLSEVFFIATANTTATIPKPLLDRMELIEVSSYTANEKFHIAKEHLVKKQLLRNGMEGKLTISDGAVKQIVRCYTREAGVRELERKIGEICRKAAREMLTKKVSVIKVTSQNLEKYLGKIKYLPDKINQKDEVGIVRGLAWTSVGGDTLQIEVNRMPGKGEIQLTGKMGEVMKESAFTAISYVRSISKEYQIDTNLFRECDFHIHIPEGAVPKDGPSAGITMATAILSAVTDIPVYANVAMTGEITLRGRVLPIGGLKEKILAAKAAGITKVLVPKENAKDVEEISKEIKEGLEIVFVERMDQVLAHALRK